MEDGPIIPRSLPLNTALFLGCVRACIVLVEDDSSFGVDFSKLADDFWQTNGGIPIRSNSSLLIKRNCCNMTRF
ncbi:unnamed protein product [Acanthoscelides obtectus]|uniref:Uncharacterized protein n=1 Tax=Acanthoscelides obtectus TaxID=200917 RepID=A0A9P0P1K5_ACAOB|nr:unnamed protein product [Acanthoscelides obtectus]CAK1629130.1 hypothetical protein AOBTE_LOCUS5596 [Acanthoscelides obtectus]